MEAHPEQGVLNTTMIKFKGDGNKFFILFFCEYTQKNVLREKKRKEK
ncbi:hypothetical protein OIU84_004443, partial [Salix udensis]